MGYGMRNERGKGSIMLHRVIMGLIDPDFIVDHISGDPLDNRRANLRVVSKQQNSWNKAKTGSKTFSQYKGVSDYSARSAINPYRSQIDVSGRTVYLGAYPTEGEAAHAYNAAALEHFGEFARLNDI